MKKISLSNIRLYSQLSKYIQKYDKYDPKIIDGCCDKLWLINNKNKNISKNLFSIIMPPPNVTGKLHIGHALSFSLQDTILRHQRMKGYNTLWWPGCDHAGIATQVQVNKYLKKKHGKQFNSNSLSREEFVNECKYWSEKKRNNIKCQIKSLALSPNWEKEYYTLDNNHSRVVETAFIELYKRGKIYRDNRIVNWSCQLQSTISDIEIDTLEINGEKSISVPGYSRSIKFGILYKVAYPLEGSDSEYIEVATTRPETIPGDVALAVSPNDFRYSSFIGRRVMNPLTNEYIPIIADIDVDPEFGTGVVKLTPGHSISDFKTAARHNLSCPNIIDNTGHMKNTSIANISGMPRFLARDAIIDYLNSINLYRGCFNNHQMKLPICSRSGDVVEYLVRPQWFFDVSEACDAVLSKINDKTVVIQPSGYEGIFTQFLKNREPWCVSRQLKWGHQIPAYFYNEAEKSMHFIDKSKELIFAKYPTLKHECLQRDEDVLDTWFSSSLLPLTMADWPDMWNSAFPSSMLVTGHDIVPLWVCRMMLMSMELTGKMPFKHVLLHGMICDSQGRKMSKSKGNVIDPMYLVGNHLFNKFMEEVQDKESSQESEIEENTRRDVKDMGADGVRFSLLEHDISGDQVNFNISKVIEARNFMQKMWQTVRFVHHNWTSDQIAESRQWNLEENWRNLSTSNYTSFNDVEKWLLLQLSELISTCDKAAETFQYHTICVAVKQFWWNSMCSVFIEWCKSETDEVKKKENLQILLLAIDTCLHLLHPVTPQLTEVLWHCIHKDTVTTQTLGHQCYPSIKVANSQFTRNFETSSIIVNDTLSKVTEINYWLKALKLPKSLLKSNETVWLSSTENTISKLKPDFIILSRLSDVPIMTNVPLNSSFLIELGEDKQLNISNTVSNWAAIESCLLKKVEDSSELQLRLVAQLQSLKTGNDKLQRRINEIEEDIQSCKKKLQFRANKNL